MKYKTKFIRVIAIACCSVFLLSSTGCRGKATQRFSKAAQRFLKFLKEEGMDEVIVETIFEYFIKGRKHKNDIYFPQ